MQLKTCTNCKKELPATLEYFPKSTTIKSGLRSRCKECTSYFNKKNHQRYYAENKEKVNKKNMENYYKRNPKEDIPEGYKKCSACGEVKPKTEEYFGKLSKAKDGFRYSCKECRHQEYKSNREHYIKRSKERYVEKKECAPIEKIKTKNKKQRNKDYIKEKDRRYYQKNKEAVKNRVKEYMYNRIENDIGFKILQRCRTRLYKAVKGYVKSARTQELIGCSVEYLLKHLESQFKEGMTWENYGEWHIDHIIPCASFDFTKANEQRKCFHYTNLQPLWADENYRKSDKLITS